MLADMHHAAEMHRAAEIHDAPEQSSCALRPVRAEDAPAVLAAFASHPDMRRQGDVDTLEDAERQVRWMLADNLRATAIVDADDVLIGQVSIMIDTLNRSGWVSYWMHAAHRGQGLMSRAAVAACDRALTPTTADGWGLERLELGHRVNNPASGAVAAAAGFVREGRERGKFLMDGERIDVLTYGRLPADPAPTTESLPWRER